MVKYKVEFMLDNLETKTDPRNGNIPFFTETEDTISAASAYLVLRNYFRPQGRGGSKVKIYRNSIEIDEEEFDVNVGKLREGFVTLEMIKKFTKLTGSKMYERCKERYNSYNK